MIRIARASDVDRLKRIWSECFGDGEPYIDFFFRNAFVPASTIVSEEDGEVCAMFFLLESSVSFQGQENRAAYLYAAATLPQYRSRGIMGSMIRFAADFCRSAGFHSIVLVPAEESLFGYYGRFGFKTAFYGVYESFRASEHTGPAAAVLSADIPEMERMRREVLRQCGGLMWYGREFSYAVREHLFTGGEILFTRAGYALYHRDGDLCCVDEWIARPDREAELRSALQHSVRAAEYRILRPPHAGDDETAVRARGMILPLTDDHDFTAGPADKPYIGLTLG